MDQKGTLIFGMKIGDDCRSSRRDGEADLGRPEVDEEELDQHRGAADEINRGADNQQ